jgi:hypothetical protein
MHTKELMKLIIQTLQKNTKLVSKDMILLTSIWIEFLTALIYLTTHHSLQCLHWVEL